MYFDLTLFPVNYTCNTMQCYFLGQFSSVNENVKWISKGTYTHLFFALFNLRAQ